MHLSKTTAKYVVVLLFALSAPYCLAAAFVVEPSDSMANAMLINSGDEVTGNLGNATGEDMLRIRASQSGVLRVYLSRAPGQYILDIAFVAILNSSGTVVAQANVYEPDYVTSVTAGVTSGNDYYVRITACQPGAPDDECSLHRQDPYSVMALVASSIGFETEPNDSLANADSIALNTLTSGAHASMTDVDYYAITVPGPGYISALVSRTESSYLYVVDNVALLDSSGSVLNSMAMDAYLGAARVTVGVRSAGVYYIRLTPCNDGSGSQCQLDVTAPYELAVAYSAATPCDRLFYNGFECGGTPTVLKTWSWLQENAGVENMVQQSE